MIKIITLCLLFASTGMLPLQSSYAGEQQLKIGFVNPVKLLELSPQGEKALRLLEEEFRPRDQELINLREQIVVLEDDLDKLKDCDWIVEVVLEDLDIKHETYKKILSRTGRPVIRFRVYHNPNQKAGFDY